MNPVDDATERRFGLLFEQETTEAAMRTLWGWIRRYGVPQALYVDSKTVFRTDREATLEEQLEGKQPLTAFGLACQKLGIEMIYAGSPPAKGRVERSHGTDQDRLIKELELAGIEEVGAANQFLQQRYWKQINQKFAIDPADPQDQHRPAPAATTLAEIFFWEQNQIMQRDGTVSYENRCFQILRENPIRPTGRARVLVRRLRWSLTDCLSRSQAPFPRSGQTLPSGSAACPLTRPSLETGAPSSVASIPATGESASLPSSHSGPIP
jgi:hypothetical protein